MMICNGVRTQITHFKFLPISPLIFATVQKFALDYFRDRQIPTPPCEWGWVLVVPLLGKTFEVEDSPGMVWMMMFMCFKSKLPHYLLLLRYYSLVFSSWILHHLLMTRIPWSSAAAGPGSLPAAVWWAVFCKPRTRVWMLSQCPVCRVIQG